MQHNCWQHEPIRLPRSGLQRGAPGHRTRLETRDDTDVRTNYLLLGRSFAQPVSWSASLLVSQSLGQPVSWSASLLVRWLTAILIVTGNAPANSFAINNLAAAAQTVAA
jgi:hypothetical protein